MLSILFESPINHIQYNIHCKQTHQSQRDLPLQALCSHPATHITRNPKCNDLQSIYCKCKVNAQSAPSILLEGGASNGHLGLIISANAYNTLAPITLYIPRQPNPAPLVQQPNNATAAQIAEALQLHQEETCRSIITHIEI